MPGQANPWSSNIRLTLSSFFSAAASVFGCLAQHDTTGTLANLASSLTDKAAVLEPTLASAATDIVEQGLAAKLGPDAAPLVEFAEPLLLQVVAYAQAKIASLNAAPAQG